MGYSESINLGNNKRRGVNKVYPFLWVITYVILCYSYIQDNNILHMFANLLMYAIVLTESEEDDFLFYIFMAPMIQFVPSSIFRTYICLAISILKILLKHNSLGVLELFSYIFIFVNTIVFDYMMASSTSFGTLLALAYYIIAVMNKKIPQRVSKTTLAWVLICSTVIILLTMYISAGVSFSDYASSANLQFRFGEQTREIGGSMGVSLYGTIAIGAIYYLLVESKKRTIQTLLLITACLLVCIFELFAVSRTFWLTIVLSSVFLIVGIRKYLKKPAILIAFIVLFIAIGAYIFNQFGDLMWAMFGKLLTYIEDASRASRFNIWRDSILFFLSNPLIFVFGFGAQNYYTSSNASKYAFYNMGSHNLVLDVLLSWGIVGFFILLFCIYKCYFKKSNKSVAFERVSIARCVPAIMWFVTMMAQGSMREPTSFLYLIAVFTFICNNESQNYNIDKCDLP